MALIATPLGWFTMLPFCKTQTVNIFIARDGAYVTVTATNTGAARTLRPPAVFELENKAQSTVLLSLEGYQPTEL
tara:strand:+ start:256 stop:480 length:225 start_codon:yes stop_codon:yes gene_type:complete